MEWVEVRGRSVDEAVAKAMEELSIDAREDAKIEVIEEASQGFLGLGGKDAVVRVSKVAQSKSRRRGRSGRSGSGRGSGGQNQPRGSKGDQRGGRQDEKSGRQDSSRRDQRGRQESGKVRKEDRPSGGSRGRGDGSRREDAGSRPRPQRDQAKKAKERNMDDTAAPEEEVDVEAQAEVVGEFLEGLVASFGLEGTVATRVEDELIIADLTGEQTEALVGPKGAIMQSVGELVRTVVQRKTHRRARLRLDVGGYLERRREALTIYANRLAQQVLDEGGELMLEPMNPADRKVVHDAAADIEGVRSFSEGEEPRRSVVISLAPGVEPRGGSERDDSAEADTSGADQDDDSGSDDD